MRRPFSRQQIAAIFAKNPRLPGVRVQRFLAGNNNSLRLSSGVTSMNLHKYDHGKQLIAGATRNTGQKNNIDFPRLFSALTRHVGKNRKIEKLRTYATNPKTERLFRRLGGYEVPEDDMIRGRGGKHIEIDIAAIRPLIDQLRKKRPRIKK